MKETTDSTGLFASLLTTAFIVLKLCGVIDWAWGWVIAPMWITVGIGLIIAVALWAINRSKKRELNKIIKVLKENKND